MKEFLLALFFVLPASVVHAQEYLDTANVEVVPATEENAGDYDGEAIEHVQVVDPDTMRTTKSYKNETLQVRKFDRSKWKKIIDKTSYVEKQEEVSVNPKPTINPWVSDLLRFAAYIIIVAFVIFLIYYIFKNVSLADTRIKKVKPVEGIEAAVENIEDLDIQKLLQQALANRDLRMAVRLYYLGMLQQLNESGMIAWKKDKTNREYLTELFSYPDYFGDIKKLTLAYELVWYGDHVLTPESFTYVVAGFETIQKNLNASKAL
jgi:hypothetical protein